MLELSAVEERLDQLTARGLANAVSRAVRDGALLPGAKLPPIRTVATQLGLSPTTVSAGWALLARSGTIRTDGRRGTTIADARHAGSPRYRRAIQQRNDFGLDLSTGVPDPKLLPDLSNALRSLTTAAGPGSYLDSPVLPELEATLRADWPYEAEQFTIVDGAMDGLELTARSVVGFGDRVVVEQPCFPLLLDLLDSLGAEAVGIPLDGEGLLPDSLRQALESPVSAVFLQPRAQNPTGVSMSRSRVRRLARLLRNTGVTIVEDDSAGSVATNASISLGQLLPLQTLHIRSFSKSHGPDLRIAAMSGPAGLIGEISGRRQLGQGWTSRLLQRVLLSLLTDDRSLQQVATAREEYAARRRAVVNHLAQAGIAVGGDDGINIWLPVADEQAAVVRLASAGIGVAPGSPFAVLPGQPDHVRVTVGLISDRYREVSDLLADAARTGGWSAPR
jgi:DNA-binding transcriptional MocR family regulator